MEKLVVLLLAFSCALLGQERQIFSTRVITSQGVVTKEYFGDEVIIRPRVAPGVAPMTMVREAFAGKNLQALRSAVSVNESSCDSFGNCYIPFRGTDLRAMSSAVSAFQADPHFEMAMLSPVLRTRQAPVSISSSQYPFASAQWYLGGGAGGIHWTPRKKTGESGACYVTIDSGLQFGHESFDRTLREPQLVWSGVNPFFTTQFSDPDFVSAAEDDNGHGTAVAGAVLSVKNTQGLANFVRYGAFKVLKFDSKTKSWVADTKTIVTAFEVLVQRLKSLPSCKKTVAQMSIGSLEKIPPIDDAIAMADKAGVFVVVAAGNDGVDADRFDQTPTTSPGANSVGAYGSESHQMVVTKEWASTYGRKTVLTSAPGQRILVPVPRPKEDVAGPVPFDPLIVDSRGYNWFEGTSISASFVAAAALRMIDDNSQITSDEIRMRLRNGNRSLLSATIWDREYSGRDLFQSGGRIDWALATAEASSETPTTPQFSLTPGHSSVRVKLLGDKNPFALRCEYNGKAIEPVVWEAIPYFGDEIIVTGPNGAPLYPDTDTQMSCQVADQFGRWSKLSDAVSFKTRRIQATPISLESLDLGPGPLVPTITRLDGFIPQVIWGMTSRVNGSPVLYAGRPESLDYRVGDNDSVADLRVDLSLDSASLHLGQFVQMQARESWGHYDRTQISVIWEEGGQKREKILTDLLPNSTSLLPAPFALDLSEFAGKSVIIRFRFFTNGSSVGIGWLISALSIGSPIN